MHYLVIDGRFGTQIYVFLELDPREAMNYPGLTVREVAIEPRLETTEGNRRTVLGRDPHNLALFREFGSDSAANAAGFILIEPRYIGPTWESYSHEFRPQGEKAAKTHRKRLTAPEGPG